MKRAAKKVTRLLLAATDGLTIEPRNPAQEATLRVIVVLVVGTAVVADLWWSVESLLEGTREGITDGIVGIILGTPLLGALAFAAAGWIWLPFFAVIWLIQRARKRLQ